MRTERWVSSHGTSVVLRGSGPLVFLLHGIGGNASTWDGVAVALSESGYQTACWDAPGYGRSADPVGDIDHCRLVFEVLGELGVPRAHLFGTSWGGVIAMSFAQRWPEAVCSLVIADSTRGSARDEGGVRAMLARVAELADWGPERFARSRARRLVSKGAPPAVLADVEVAMGEVRFGGYRAAARMMASTDLSDVLSSVEAPTLVLVGGEDIVTGVAESATLAESIPGARFTVIENAGHAAVQERPAEVASAVIAFLEASADVSDSVNKSS
ncbi:alpha/beta fold hydrolase [Homoserinimonas sp. A447]